MPKLYVPVGPREKICSECGTDYLAKSMSSKYCGRACARKAQAAHPGKPCTRSGCSTKARAKGLCATHYNATLANRHKKIEATCDECGQPTLKEQRTKRYRGTYCSQLCRDYAQWGALSTKLPAEHWARHIGSTCAWVAPRTFECAWCHTPGRVAGNRDTYCSETCTHRAKRARRRGREYGAAGTYTWGQVVRLWGIFDRACAYCQTPTPLAEIQAEHVIALARGGDNSIGNILPSCAACNSDKRDLSMNEWEADRTRRGLPHVTTQWTRDDPRYKHLTLTQGSLAAA